MAQQDLDGTPGVLHLLGAGYGGADEASEAVPPQAVAALAGAGRACWLPERLVTLRREAPLLPFRGSRMPRAMAWRARRPHRPPGVGPRAAASAHVPRPQVTRQPSPAHSRAGAPAVAPSSTWRQLPPRAGRPLPGLDGRGAAPGQARARWPTMPPGKARVGGCARAPGERWRHGARQP